MSNLKNKKPISERKSIPGIMICSTVILILILLVYFATTSYNIRQFHDQLTIVSEHPFKNTRNLGEIKASVTQMQVYMEQVKLYDSLEMLEEMDQKLDKLYMDTDIRLQEVELNFLGIKENILQLKETYYQIKEVQHGLLDHALYLSNGFKRDETYDLQDLSPLYQQFNSQIDGLLNESQDIQRGINQASDQLQDRALLWAKIMVCFTILVLLIFQYVLQKQNKEIYFKKQQFDILSDTIDEAFMIFRANGPGCDLVSDNAWDVLGLTAKQLSEDRKLVYQFVDEESRDLLISKIYEVNTVFPWEGMVKYQNPRTHMECRMNVRLYKVSVSKKESKFIAIVMDRTEDFIAREALMDALASANSANNAKRDFLSRMSHEIRTPMNAIIGMTTIAAASIHDLSRVEDCLSKISYSSKHLLMLINDILDMSRIESNKMQLSNEAFDLYQFINSFVSIIYPQVHDKGILFDEKMKGFDANTTFIGDPLRLNQILLNLMSNAIKFTSEGGCINLEIKKRAQKGNKVSILFQITDTGIGMDENMVDRLFDPFEQADASTAQKYGGTGLGMSITKNLVSLMGGYLEVKSKLGEGTCCTVVLDLEKSEEQLEEERSISPKEVDTLRVLVADDEKDICDHTMILLKNMNIRAEWVLSGMEAVTQVVEANESGDCYDVCFIDYKMPEMDGIETTRRIRKSIGPDTPIIIISSFDWNDIEEEARAAGVNAFIAKPLFLSSLYNTLVNVTHGSFARAAIKEKEISASLVGKRILIAEDNDLNLEIAKELLEMSGALVVEASNGAVALERFLDSQAGYYDAILMDVQMPVMDGYTATRQIRSCGHPDALSIPIIATTANAFAEDASAALAAGMNYHIGKPIDMKELCRVLSISINKK